MRKSYNMHRQVGKTESCSPVPSDSGSASDSRPLLSRVKGLLSQSNNSLTMEDRLRDKFRGCLAGALIGDCIGTLFECDYSVSYSILGDLYQSLTNLSEDEILMDLHGIDFSLGPKLAQELLERKRLSIVPSTQIEEISIEPSFPPKRHSSFEKRRGSFSRPIEKYSDDTVMTRSVIMSIIRMRGFDPRDMAAQMTEDYFLNLTRKYGAYSREIFTQLRNNGYSDPYGPARKAQGSIGSLGNEGATRVAPIALFLWNSDPTVVLDMASKITKITNYHKSAIIGAACQCLAVHTAFNWDFIKDNEGSSFRRRLKSRLSPSPQMRRKMCDQENIPLSCKNELEFDYKGFCNQVMEGISHSESKTASLFENLKSLVTSNRESAETGESAYAAKIQTIIEFMERSEAPSRLEVVQKLGNGVKAIDSVLSALFSFLMSASSAKFPELPVHIKSPVLRSIFYAISLGGDSDTTASMAGAIAGAYWGYETIPQEILRVCEGSNEIVKLADELFNHCHNNL